MAKLSWKNLKAKLYLPPQYETLDRRLKDMITIMSDRNGSVPSWNEKSVALWMSIAVEGKQPQVASYILLLQLCKLLGRKGIKPFSKIFTNTRTIRALTVASAGSPYFAVLVEEILSDSRPLSLHILAVDPLNHAIYPDLLRHYGRIGRKFFRSKNETSDRSLELHGVNNQEIVFHDGLFDKKLITQMSDSFELILLTSLIFEPRQGKEMASMLGNFRASLKQEGVLILYFDIYETLNHSKLEYLIEGTKKTGFSLAFPPFVLALQQNKVKPGEDIWAFGKPIEVPALGASMVMDRIALVFTKSLGSVSHRVKYGDLTKFLRRPKHMPKSRHVKQITFESVGPILNFTSDIRARPLYWPEIKK